MSITLADLLAAPLMPWSARTLPPLVIPLETMRRYAARIREANALARLRWHIAVEWQILAHSVRNCTSAADARYAIDLRAQLD